MASKRPFERCQMGGRKGPKLISVFFFLSVDVVVRLRCRIRLGKKRSSVASKHVKEAEGNLFDLCIFGGIGSIFSSSSVCYFRCCAHA